MVVVVTIAEEKTDTRMTNVQDMKKQIDVK
jgi:hypothetical protein